MEHRRTFLTGPAGTGKTTQAVAYLRELVLSGAQAEGIVRADAPTLEAALVQVRDMASRSRIYVVFGMPHIGKDGRRHNSAYAISPEGEVLTRYDQLVVDRMAEDDVPVTLHSCGNVTEVAHGIFPPDHSGICPLR